MGRVVVDLKDCTRPLDHLQLAQLASGSAGRVEADAHQALLPPGRNQRAIGKLRGDEIKVPACAARLRGLYTPLGRRAAGADARPDSSDSETCRKRTT